MRWSKYPELVDKRWLYKHYIIKNLTAKQVADIVGCQPEKVYKALHGHKLKRPKQVKLYQIKEFIEAQYVRGVGMTEVAEICNCSVSTIKTHLRACNITCKPRGGEWRSIGISDELVQILNGLLLGDGSIELCRKTSARYRHTDKHEAYIKWLFTHLKNRGLDWGGGIYRNDTKWGVGYGASTFLYRNLLDWCTKWYPKGKKIVPADILITPLTLLHWFIGDGWYSRGYKKRKWGGIGLATDGFTHDEVDFLAGQLQLQNIQANVNYHKNRYNDRGFRIIIYRPSSIRRFFEYMAPCPEEIEDLYGYKFPNTKGIKCISEFWHA